MRLTAGCAQARRPALVAILEPASGAAPSGGVLAFKQALAELGWVQGRTVGAPDSSRSVIQCGA